MKVIAIAAVTAGGKTTTVNEIKKQLSNVQTLIAIQMEVLFENETYTGTYYFLAFADLLYGYVRVQPKGRVIF